MKIVKSYRYYLDRSSKKFRCPQCRDITLVRYIDSRTNSLLPDHVGRCDHENRCGYHIKPSEYFKSIGQIRHTFYNNTLSQSVAPIAPIKPDTLPIELVHNAMDNEGFMKTNFATFLTNRFGEGVARKALVNYLVGRSKIDTGKGCIFWRINNNHEVRTGKIMAYDPLTGKRKKDIDPTWVHTKYKPYNSVLCFFGEYLIDDYPEKTIAIVESEKTAIICSIFMPQYTWIATGGASGCKWREYQVFKVLANRDVLLYPDFGFYNKKTGKTCFQEWSERAERIKDTISCKIKVCTVLEQILPESERCNDYDLADMLLEKQIK